MIFSGHYIQKKNPEYTFFSSARETFPRIDHILGHKTNLNKFKNIQIISSKSSDHNSMKLEINHRKRKKKTITQRLNNMLLKKQWVKEEIKEEIYKFLEANDNENTTIQNLWDAAKAFIEVHSNTGLLYETRKISNNLIHHLKQLEKEEQTKPKVSRRRETIKIREKIEILKTKLEKSIKPRAD